MGAFAAPVTAKAHLTAAKPDGSAYKARKPQKHDKKGRVGRKMFTELRTERYLKIKAALDMAEVYFSDGRIERIAATHQYGLREKLGKCGPVAKYPLRQLIGLTGLDVDSIGGDMIDYLSDKQ